MNLHELNEIQKSKCKVLYVGDGNAVYMYRLGEELIETNLDDSKDSDVYHEDR